MEWHRFAEPIYRLAAAGFTLLAGAFFAPVLWSVIGDNARSETETRRPVGKPAGFDFPGVGGDGKSVLTWLVVLGV